MKGIFVYSLLACLWLPVVSAAEPAPVPFELQPYRIRVSLACAESVDLDAELCRTVLREFPQISDRLLGEMWTVSAVENDWLFPPSSEHLGELSAGRLPDDWMQSTCDKTFLVTLEQSGGQYVLSGREWDAVSRTFGSVSSRTVQQRRELSAELFRLAHELFRPRLQIDRATSETASVTVQAGSLPPADPEFSQLKKQQFWQPFLRYRDSKGAVERLQPLPWTLLQVTDIDSVSQAHGQAKIVSGLRSAVPTRRRARVDVFARALVPAGSETELRLISRQSPQKPLIGVVVDARSKPDSPTVRMLTDRNGAIRLPARPQDPLLWLTVKSGEKTLAVLPIVPGLENQLTAELPDDSIRLRVEGELSILQSNLTDTVAQRAVLMARIRRLVQLGDWKSANELRKELGLLPITDTYLQELNAIRIPSIKAAQAAKDRVSLAYIERVCGDVSKLIQKYLDEEKLKIFDEELKELERSLQKAAKATPKP